jgi:hypothetical protein
MLRLADIGWNGREVTETAFSTLCFQRDGKENMQAAACSISSVPDEAFEHDRRRDLLATAMPST